jgi:hypothetical protein
MKTFNSRPLHCKSQSFIFMTAFSSQNTELLGFCDSNLSSGHWSAKMHSVTKVWYNTVRLCSCIKSADSSMTLLCIFVVLPYSLIRRLASCSVENQRVCLEQPFQSVSCIHLLFSCLMANTMLFMWRFLDGDGFVRSAEVCTAGCAVR